MAKVFFVYGPMNSSKTASLIMAAFNYREESQNPVILKPSLDNRDGVDPIIKSRPGLTAGCVLVGKDEDLFKTVARLNGATDADIEWYDRHIDSPMKVIKQIKAEYLSKMTLSQIIQSNDPEVVERVKSGLRERSLPEPMGLASRHQLLLEFAKRFDNRVDCVLIDEVQFISEAQVEQLLDIADYLNIPVMAYGLRNDFKGNGFPASIMLMSQAEVLRENKGVCWCGSKATHVLRIDENGNIDTDGPQIKVGGNDTYRATCRFHFKAGEYKKDMPKKLR